MCYILDIIGNDALDKNYINRDICNPINNFIIY